MLTNIGIAFFRVLINLLLFRNTGENIPSGTWAVPRIAVLSPRSIPLCSPQRYSVRGCSCPRPAPWPEHQQMAVFRIRIRKIFSPTESVRNGIPIRNQKDNISFCISNFKLLKQI